MSREHEKQLADQLFGQGRVKEVAQSIAPGLSWDKIVGDVGHELNEKLGQGAHELAAALFNGSGFVMYPRGTRDNHGKDGHGVHGPEQSPGDQSLAEKPHEKDQQERSGREM